MRVCTCVSGVLLVGFSLPSADLAVVVVKADVVAQRIFIFRNRTRTSWNRSEQAVTMGR
jgi:hypothetical protein